MVATVLQIGLPGTQEMMIILLIAVLLFGANKIPKLARSTGEAMGEFQKGREEVESELEEMRNQPGEEAPSPSPSDATGTTQAVETASDQTAGTEENDDFVETEPVTADSEE